MMKLSSKIMQLSLMIGLNLILSLFLGSTLASAETTAITPLTQVSEAGQTVPCQNLKIDYTGKGVKVKHCQTHPLNSDPRINGEDQDLNIDGLNYTFDITYTRALRDTYLIDYDFEDFKKDFFEETGNPDSKPAKFGDATYQSFGKQCLVILVQRNAKHGGWGEHLYGLYCRDKPSKAFSQDEARQIISNIKFK